MRKLIALFAITVFSSTFAYSGTFVYVPHPAYAQLVKSTPADGSVSDTPPSAFVFEFSEAVKFHEIYIKRDDGKSTPIGKLPEQRRENDHDTRTLTDRGPLRPRVGRLHARVSRAAREHSICRIRRVSGRDIGTALSSHVGRQSIRSVAQRGFFCTGVSIASA